MHSSSVVDVDPIPSAKIHQKNDVRILISPDHDYSCHLVGNKVDTSPSTITTKTCNQPVELDFHPTDFKSRIRERSFKPLRLSSTLYPYPSKFFEYLPLFTREDHITTEKHLGAFHNFVDNFENVHKDVVMRIFSKYLVGNVGS